MKNSMEVASDNVAQTHETCAEAFLRKLKRLKPINFWSEVGSISRLAVPTFASQLMISLLGIVSSVFCGHLGKVELDAVSLAIVTINLSSVSIGVGLCTACDTFISQTHGSKNLKRIGVILQRGILILLIACFPCWAVFINIEHILLALNQLPAVAKLSQFYVKIFIPGLPAVFLYQLEVRYLQNQGIFMPQVFVGFITNIFNAVVNYLFLYVLTLGVPGSAAANVASQYCQLLLLFGYIRWKKLHVHSWAGWSTDCLQEWGNFLRLAIPSMAMICSEWWATDIITFLSGLVNEVELGAQTIISQIIVVIYKVPLGFGMAATVYVGNALGAGNPQQAVNSAKVAVCCAGSIALVLALILTAMKDVVGCIFINDKEIIHLVADVIPLSAAYHQFDAVLVASGGVLRGAGMQKLGAIGNLIGYYVVGLPIGIALMFAAKLYILGLWIGMFVCAVVQTIFFLTVIYRINWKEASDEAQVNAGVMKNADTSRRTSTTQTQYRSTDVDTRNRAVNPIPDVSQSEIQTEEDQVLDTSSIVDTGVTTVGEILSTKQLIIRRGLAFLSGPLILAIGLTVHFILSKDM
ncbi:multidrug and toxin extrusion protein 1-like isoform X2 [Stegostoma tigrinum]|nr:multidrug and toxin extrusion protein 1-like isoform X2 [Stegostoma tigrinum]